MRWTAMVLGAVVLLAVGGCAQEADDVLEAEPRGTVTTDDTESSGSGGAAAPLFAPVLNMVPAPCEGQPDLTPDRAGESCYQLGTDTLSADVIESADAELDPTSGRWQVSIVLTEDGIDEFNVLILPCFSPSDECPTGQLAILLDGEVLSAPTIQQPSFERDQIAITGNFTEEEADEIAAALDP
jgi:preprotein translocase subunit SecD